MNKIRNSTSCEYDGIKFKSKLEMRTYKLFQEEEFNFRYEPEKVLLWQGIILNKVKLYKSDKGFETNPKLRDITYTPDFLIKYKSLRIYIDTKGYMNDVYPIKKKMFLKLLQEEKPKKDEDGKEVTYLFFEPSSIKEVKEVIDLIKTL